MLSAPCGLALALALSCSVHAAQEAGVPGSYLDFAGGPRVIGMSRAYVGLAEGTDAVAWNPAGLGLLRPNMLSLSHTQTAEGAYFENLSYAQPIYRMGAVGVSYVRLDSGSIPQTDEFNRPVGKFRDVQQTVMAAYGLRPFSPVSIGGTFKYSQQSLAGNSASGWGMDIGVLGMLRRGTSLGIKVKNAVAPALKFDTATDQFPRAAIFGLAQRLWRERLAVTLDAERGLGPGAGEMQWRMGVEGTLFQIAKLRGGFDFRAREFSVGLGYQFGRQSLDYVNSTSRQASASGHHFGLSLAFGGYPVTVRAEPEQFSPVGLQKNTKMIIQVNHSKRIYSWELQIRDQNRDLIKSVRGSGNPPPHLEWDGTRQDGMLAVAGSYTYVLTLVDEDGRKEHTPPQIVRVTYGAPVELLSVQ
ncbi:MAG: PorV/PorQ family protein [Elusimicrobia bacterium]|nr:PorV/PorQ family protein [Elusimicrobiota bacterium]